MGTSPYNRAALGRAWYDFNTVNEYQIRIEDKAAPEDVQALWRNLYEFNVAQTGQRGQFIAVFLRDRKGRIVGGAHGWTAFEWRNDRARGKKEGL